ncbi:probable signal peptidase (endopeptidase SP18) [Serendipita indica DSM 11827]|uniref:Signal peptidase complex catalytic subunit SEC11 n=1 Tax=Serendipita indica (strain DSM 11827) TaxID=1109443 RepID=G4TLG6_SERID|nr:probable signal peptidase (endopeptidase SP18) [Serendipita indica DSM 11827]
MKFASPNGFRRSAVFGLDIANAIVSAFMFWIILCILLNNSTPVVAVLSGSMEPGFSKGDILILYKSRIELYGTGDIIVYQVPGDDIPIVHRVLETYHETTLGQLEFLTKGDANLYDDTSLYKIIPHLSTHHVVGKVVGYVPYVGCVSILANSPWKNDLREYLRQRLSRLY